MKKINIKNVLKSFICVLLVFLLVGCNNEIIETKYDEVNSEIFDNIPISDTAKQGINMIGLNIYSFNYDAKYIDGIIEDNKITFIFYLNAEPSSVKDDFIKAMNYLSSISSDHKIYDNKNKVFEYDNLSSDINDISFNFLLSDEKYNVNIKNTKEIYEDKECNAYVYTFMF